MSEAETDSKVFLAIIENLTNIRAGRPIVFPPPDTPEDILYNDYLSALAGKTFVRRRPKPTSEPKANEAARKAGKESEKRPRNASSRYQAVVRTESEEAEEMKKTRVVEEPPQRQERKRLRRGGGRGRGRR